MPLTDEQIKMLLTVKPAKRKSRSKLDIDTSVRDHATWFALAHKLLDQETNELMKCSNPACADPRGGRGSVVALVSGQWMCRYCFMSGWLLHDNPNQLSL